MNSKQQVSHDFITNIKYNSNDNDQIKQSVSYTDIYLMNFKRLLLSCLIFLLAISLVTIKMQGETIEWLAVHLHEEQSTITLE